MGEFKEPILLLQDQSQDLPIHPLMPTGIIGVYQFNGFLYLRVGSGVPQIISSGGAAIWGGIIGTLSNQTDLWNYLQSLQPAGNYITELTSDVSAFGPGIATATVNFVGGASAANIAAATAAYGAATSMNTPGTLVLRNGLGNFSAGAITANLIGNVTGNVSGSSGSFTGSLAGDVT